MFWRGCDVYDPKDMGFEHGPKTDYCPRVFPFDTSLRGEGNGGHLYGTALPEIEKDELIEFMKTL